MKYITMNALQEKLGGRSRSQLYRDFGPEGWLPKPTKIGSRLYFNEADVDAAIASLAA